MKKKGGKSKKTSVKKSQNSFRKSQTGEEMSQTSVKKTQCKFWWKKSHKLVKNNYVTEQKLVNLNNQISKAITKSKHLQSFS